MVFELSIDHLVLAAPSREEGMQYVSEQLGVTPEFGGKHSRMGTHNALLKLNDKMYLEVIAIDPEATNPPGKRWFALDDLELTEPRLITWVVRTGDIHDTAKRVLLGNIEAMSRGDLHWLISIQPDGQLNMNGAVPLVIEWLGDMHPYDTMNDSGCALIGMEIRHPEANEVSRTLEQIGFASPLVQCYVDEKPRLIAKIDTPIGICELR